MYIYISVQHCSYSRSVQSVSNKKEQFTDEFSSEEPVGQMNGGCPMMELW